MLAQERMATRLGAMPLFSNLAADKLSLLASLLKFERSKAGEKLFTVGDVYAAGRCALACGLQRCFRV